MAAFRFLWANLSLKDNGWIARSGVNAAGRHGDWPDTSVSLRHPGPEFSGRSSRTRAASSILLTVETLWDSRWPRTSATRLALLHCHHCQAPGIREQPRLRSTKKANGRADPNADALPPGAAGRSHEEHPATREPVRSRERIPATRPSAGLRCRSDYRAGRSLGWARRGSAAPVKKNGPRCRRGPLRLRRLLRNSRSAEFVEQLRQSSIRAEIASLVVIYDHPCELFELLRDGA